jgi:hypothetical protein
MRLAGFTETRVNLSADIVRVEFNLSSLPNMAVHIFDFHG